MVATGAMPRGAATTLAATKRAVAKNRFGPVELASAMLPARSRVFDKRAPRDLDELTVRHPNSQAEGRGFESRFPLQNTYTLRKAGHLAQPLSFQVNDQLLFRQGNRRPPLGERWSVLLTAHKDDPKCGRYRYGWSFGTPQALHPN